MFELCADQMATGGSDADHGLKRRSISWCMKFGIIWSLRGAFLKGCILACDDGYMYTTIELLMTYVSWIAMRILEVTIGLSDRIE